MRFIPPPSLSVNRVRWFRGGGVLSEFINIDNVDIFFVFDGGAETRMIAEEYGLEFKKTVDLDIGLKYDAINKKQIDAMNIFTTDGQPYR